MEVVAGEAAGAWIATYQTGRIHRRLAAEAHQALLAYQARFDRHPREHRIGQPDAHPPGGAARPRRLCLGGATQLGKVDVVAGEAADAWIATYQKGAIHHRLAADVHAALLRYRARYDRSELDQCRSTAA